MRNQQGMADIRREGKRGSALLDECRASWDAWEHFSSSRAGAAVMFVWALAEAIAWPIIPDFLLVPLAAGSRSRLYAPLLASVVGSAVGGLALYTFALQAPDRALALLEHLPLVSERQINEARVHLATNGGVAFVQQPWSGVPVKVWVIEAGAQRIDPVVAVPTFVIARGVRMSIFALLAGFLAARVRRFLRDFSLYVGVMYMGVFSVGVWKLLS